MSLDTLHKICKLQNQVDDLCILTRELRLRNNELQRRIEELEHRLTLSPTGGIWKIPPVTSQHLPLK